MQNKSDFYRIHITPDLKPTLMERGELDENGNKRGTTIQVEVQPPEIWLPNGYEHAVQKQYNARGEYEGKIKFCGIGDEGAEIIEIRFLNSCPSLDVKYQELKKYDAITETEQIGWEYRGNYQIEFEIENTPPLMLEFFKHAPYNGSYERRDKNTRILFVELDGTKSVNSKKELFKKEQLLFDVKKNLMENDEYVEVLSEIFEISSGYDLDTRRDMLTDLLASQGVEFINKIDKIKSKIENQTEYLFKEGSVSILKGKIIENENKKTVHPNTFKSEKPSEIAEELAIYSMTDKKSFLEWKKMESKLLQLT